MNKKASIVATANRLNIPPEWLSALIHFETGGTYDPAVKNPASSARGLIQVTDGTARDMFDATDSLSLVREYNTFETQMNAVVYPYLEKYGPYTDFQQLCMAVFYPAYRNMPGDTEFPAWVQKVNPGIVTINDYVSRVKKRLGKWPSKPIVSAVMIVAVTAGAIWWINRR
jgi:hypothetical protein